eukprot:s588_g4.t2
MAKQFHSFTFRSRPAANAVTCLEAQADFYKEKLGQAPQEQQASARKSDGRAPRAAGPQQLEVRATSCVRFSWRQLPVSMLAAIPPAAEPDSSGSHGSSTAASRGGGDCGRGPGNLRQGLVAHGYVAESSQAVGLPHAMRSVQPPQAQWCLSLRGSESMVTAEKRTPEDETAARRPPRAPVVPAAMPAERQKVPAAALPVPVAPLGDRRAAAEQEAVSKKPRVPVEYTPATVEEYKQRFGGNAEYSELGHLGPDLDDEGLLMKRAIQEKVKQFSRELHRVNKQRAERAPLPKQPQPKPEPKSTARAKARDVWGPLGFRA